MGSSPKSKDDINREVEQTKSQYEYFIAQCQRRIAETHQHTKLLESDKAFIAREKAHIAKLKAEMKSKIAQIKARR